MANITNVRKIHFDPKLSEDVVDLISKMLNKNPLTRITLPEIFEHVWIKKFEKHFKMEVDDFRTKTAKFEEMAQSRKIAPAEFNEEKLKELEEGYSPPRSPARKLKKKPLLREATIEVKDREGVLTEDSEDNNDEHSSESFFYKILRKLGKICKC